VPDRIADPSLTTAGPGMNAPRRRSFARAVLPWVLGAAVVLTLAVTGGLLAAYLVANARAVPPPVGLATLPPATSGATIAPSGVTPAPTLSTSQPRRTPTSVIDTPGPTPIVYVVQPGDTITKIALRFGVLPDDIIALNHLTNPNLIVPNQVLLIPVPAPSSPPASP
jgi:LysM repeat protein